MTDERVNAVLAAGENMAELLRAAIVAGSPRGADAIAVRVDEWRDAVRALRGEPYDHSDPVASRRAEPARPRHFPRIIGPAEDWYCACRVLHLRSMTYCAACGRYAPWIGRGE